MASSSLEFDVDRTKCLFTFSYLFVLVTVVTYTRYNDDDAALEQIEINVLVFSTESPSIHSIFPAHQLVNETDTFEIFCNATGNPPPVVTWTKIGDNIKVYPTGNSLRVQNAEKSDFGTFQCTAESVRGEKISSVATVEIDNCK